MSRIKPSRKCSCRSCSCSCLSHCSFLEQMSWCTANTGQPSPCLLDTGIPVLIFSLSRSLTFWQVGATIYFCSYLVIVSNIVMALFMAVSAEYVHYDLVVNDTAIITVPHLQQFQVCPHVKVLAECAQTASARPLSAHRSYRHNRLSIHTGSMHTGGMHVTALYRSIHSLL